VVYLTALLDTQTIVRSRTDGCYENNEF